MTIIFAVLVGTGVITFACAIILGLHITTCETARWWQAHKHPAAGRAAPAPRRDTLAPAGTRHRPPPGPDTPPRHCSLCTWRKGRCTQCGERIAVQVRCPAHEKAPR